MPTGNDAAPWIPKAFRPESLPSYDDLIDLLSALEKYASKSTRELFDKLSRMTPSDRVLEATHFTVDCMASNPVLSSVLKQALKIEEYASLCEASVLPLSQRQKDTVHKLLCIREREMVASFFRVAFRTLREHDSHYIKPFDNITEEVDDD